MYNVFKSGILFYAWNEGAFAMAQIRGLLGLQQ